MEVVTILNDVEKQVTVTEADLNVNIENNSEEINNVKWSRYLHRAIICLLLMLLLWTNFAQPVPEKPKVSFSVHGAELDLNEPQYLLPYRLRFKLQFNNTNNWRQQFEVLDLSFSTQNTPIAITTMPDMHRHYTGFEEISTLTILRVEKEIIKQWRATGNVTIDAENQWPVHYSHRQDDISTSSVFCCALKMIFGFKTEKAADEVKTEVSIDVESQKDTFKEAENPVINEATTELESGKEFRSLRRLIVYFLLQIGYILLFIHLPNRYTSLLSVTTTTVVSFIGFTVVWLNRKCSITFNSQTKMFQSLL